MIFETVDDFKRFVLRRLVSTPARFRHTYQYSLVNASFIDLDTSEYNIDLKNHDEHQITIKPYGYIIWGWDNNITFLRVNEDLINITTHVDMTEWKNIDDILEDIFSKINEVKKLLSYKEYNISIDFDGFYFYEEDKKMIENELKLLEKENK